MHLRMHVAYCRADQAPGRTLQQDTQYSTYYGKQPCISRTAEPAQDWKAAILQLISASSVSISGVVEPFAVIPGVGAFSVIDLQMIAPSRTQA